MDLETLTDPPNLMVPRVHLRMLSLRTEDIVNWKNVPMIYIYYIEWKERYHPQMHLAPKWVALDGSRGKAFGRVVR